MKVLMSLLMSVFLIASNAPADEVKPSKPAERDKCAVCGMFVAKYPDFLAQIVFKDGSVAFFDGAKDMFKYYFNVKKYAPSKDPSQVNTIYVNDYYALTPVDAKKAFYVIGSNVDGPMGHELIPFEKEADAGEFMFDHLGTQVLPFSAITPEIVKSLD